MASGTSFRSLLESLVLAQLPKFSALHTRHRSHLPFLFHRHSIAFSLSSSSPYPIIHYSSLFPHRFRSCALLSHDTIFRYMSVMLMHVLALLCALLSFLWAVPLFFFFPSSARQSSVVVLLYHLVRVPLLLSLHYLINRTKGFAVVACSSKIPFALF